MLYDGSGKFYIDNFEKKASNDCEIFEHIDAYPFFEVIRVIGRIPLFLNEHINRLNENFEFLNYGNPPGDKELKIALYSAIRENEVEEQNIKLSVVEDDYEKRHIFAYPVKSSYPTEEQYEKGVPVILIPMERTVMTKLYSDLSFEDIWRKILREGAFEALLMSSDAKIREGSRSNVFFVFENKIITAPEEEIISTVNRRLVLEVIKELGLEVEIRSLSVKDLYFIEGAFLAGSLIGIMPISRIEGIALNSKNNETIARIKKLYDEKIGEFIEENAPEKFD